VYEENTKSASIAFAVQSHIVLYNNITYYTTDKTSTYDVSISKGGHLVPEAEM